MRLNVSCWRQQVEIYACVGRITGGLLLAMVAIILIDEFWTLFKGNAGFALR